MRRVSVVLISVFLSIIVSPHPAYSAACPLAKAKQMCGPSCMLEVCNRLGVQATLPELTKLASWTEKDGTSMAGLINAAQTKGLHASALKISIDELSTLKTPAIAFLWDSHFVVVEAKDADTMWYTDPPSKTVVIAKDSLQSSYSGFSVVVSKEPLSLSSMPISGPDVRFGEYAWNYGTVYACDPIKHTFCFANVGDKDLRILKVDVSSPDVAALFTEEAISPGGKGEVEVVLDASELSSSQLSKLQVVTNDPVSPVVELRMSGYVRPAILPIYPSAVEFGYASRSSGSSRSVFVPSPAQAPVRISSATCDSPFLKTSIRRGTSNGLPGYFVDVTLKENAPLGDLDAKLVIKSNHPRQPVTEVPVCVCVTGDASPDRNSFFFGLVKRGRPAAASVTVCNAGRRPVKVKSAQCKLPYVTVKVEPKQHSSDYRIIAKLDSSKIAGNVQGDVVIRTDNAAQPEIRLPIAAYVED